MTAAGMSHERFCTLCGLTFCEYTELWDASLNMADIIWVSYYRVRKWLKAEQPRVTIMLSVLQSGHGMARSETKPQGSTASGFSVVLVRMMINSNACHHQGMILGMS